MGALRLFKELYGAPLDNGIKRARRCQGIYEVPNHELDASAGPALSRINILVESLRWRFYSAGSVRRQGRNVQSRYLEAGSGEGLRLFGDTVADTHHSPAAPPPDRLHKLAIVNE